MARELDIPLYIAAPASNFDLSIADGTDLEYDEVRSFCVAAASETPAHPAFDVTLTPSAPRS